MPDMPRQPRRPQAHLRTWLTACALLATAAATQAASPAAAVFASASPSVITIRTDKALGSGVVIHANATGSLIVTNCHVIEDARRITAKTIEGQTLRVSPRGGDSELDICLLKADEPLPPARIRSYDSLVTGENVYAIGSPQGFEATISPGIISALRSMRGIPGDLIQTTAPISQGSSGGGLFDENGKLIGITTSMWRKGQNINFAVPASAIYATANKLTTQGGRRTPAAIPSDSAPPPRPFRTTPRIPRTSSTPLTSENDFHITTTKGGAALYISTYQPTSSGAVLTLKRIKTETDEETRQPYDTTLGTLTIDCREHQYRYGNEQRLSGGAVIREIPFVQSWADFGNFPSLEDFFEVVCESEKIPPTLHPIAGSTVTVTAEKANLRDRPSFASSQVIAELPQGLSLPALGRIGAYYKVAYSGGHYYLSRKSAELK